MSKKRSARVCSVIHLKLSGNLSSLFTAKKNIGHFFSVNHVIIFSPVLKRGCIYFAYLFPLHRIHLWTWWSWRGNRKLPNEHPLEHCETIGITGRFPCLPLERAMAVPLPHQIPRFQVWGSNPSQGNFCDVTPMTTHINQSINQSINR